MNLKLGKGKYWQMLFCCLWKVCLVEKQMSFPELFNDRPIPSSSEGEGETREILLAGLSYFNQACLNISSEEKIARR